MGGGKSGGGSSKTYDYYGTVAGAVCLGPVDALVAIIVDGREIVSGPVTLTDDKTELTLNSGEEHYLGKNGKIWIYKGTDTQSADENLAGHPSYRGISIVVFKNLLFGREKPTAPNIQVVVRRKPVVPTTIVAAEDNTITDDHQINPVAALAEIALSPYGLALPTARLNGASWQAAAAWVKDSSRIARTYCSPLLTETDDARVSIRRFLEMFDGILYWDTDGTLSIALIDPGVTPGGLPTIDARHIVKRHRMDSPGWTEVPTSVFVRYPDRDKQFKERDAKADNLLALRIRGGVPNTEDLERPFVTSGTQAFQIAADIARRTWQPIGEIDIEVRRPFATGLHPGAKILVDVEPEPGGTALAQLCVVQEVRTPDVGPIRLVLRPDTLVDAVLYAPEWYTEAPQAAECPPIDASACLAIPLPRSKWPTPSVAVMVPRPRADVVGFRIYFSTESNAEFADLGQQDGFALPVTLGADITAEDEDVILEIDDEENNPDAYLAERYPGTTIGAAQDTLLLLIANVGGDGRVVVTGGVPEMEFCSIATRSIVGSDMVYEIIRARHGTANRPWTTSAKAWILPGVNLDAWHHELMWGMAGTGEVGILRLVAFTRLAEDESTPIPSVEFQFPQDVDPRPQITWTLPSTSSSVVNGSNEIAIEALVTDGDGDLVIVSLALHRQSDGKTIDFPPWTLPSTTEFAVDQTILVPEDGTWDIVITAQDTRHPPVQSRRQVYRGGGLRPPAFDPPGLGHIPYWLTSVPSRLEIEVSIHAPADRIEYAITKRGGPLLPGDIQSTSLLPLTLYLVTDRRIWARAGDGTNWSGWINHDYNLELGNAP